MDFIYMVASTYLIPLVLCVGLLAAFVMVPMTLNYNYHYFIIHGKLLWKMGEDAGRQGDKVKELSGLDTPHGFLDIVVAEGVILSIGLVGALFWPVIVLFGIYIIFAGLLMLFFRNKHRKTMFEMRLKGLYSDRDRPD